MTSKTGTVNNVIQVRRTDFEVFDALKVDSQDSADLSGRSTLYWFFKKWLLEPLLDSFIKVKVCWRCGGGVVCTMALHQDDHSSILLNFLWE